MKLLLTLSLFFLLTHFCVAQTNSTIAAPPAKDGTDLQKAIAQLTQSNHDMLELLKKQQAVLEDLQFDRRQQSRQIESLEERLTESQLENSQLQNKVANLAADAAVRPPVAMAPLPGAASQTSATTNSPAGPDGKTADPDSAPLPSTYLPAPDSEGVPGTMSWHRLFTLKGSDNKKSDLFHVEGKTWRVLWHNQDPAGKVYRNTSALFINAFPKDDTIPQKVCSKLGTGGDSSELNGPGNYFLKIEASGGSWELAVEDFR
jgi:hypothetical protein